MKFTFKNLFNKKKKKSNKKVNQKSIIKNIELKDIHADLILIRYILVFYLFLILTIITVGFLYYWRYLR